MTRHFILLGSLLALLAGSISVTKADEEPKTEPKPKATPEPVPTAPVYITDYDIVGDIIKVDDKSITIRVTWYTTPPVKLPKGGNYGNWNHGTSGRNPQAMYQHQMMMQQKLMSQLAKAQSKAANAKATEHHQDYVMNFTSDGQARVRHLPPKTDDKGKPTNYTADEIQKMRGNQILPGYIVELSQLKVGQLVEAHLVHAPREKDHLVRWALILNEKSKTAPASSASLTAVKKN